MSPPFRLEALAAIADSAAELARDLASAPLGVTRKPDGSPVTAVDQAVNTLLKRSLTELLPGCGWLSEETADNHGRLDRDLVWIVDPIDGTKQLLAGIPEFAISIGLASKGRVVAAAVVNPTTEESGVWVVGELPVFHGLTPRPAPPNLAETDAIVSRSESDAGDLADLHVPVVSTRPIGSVAYKLLRVAAGADVLTYSVLPKHEWDVCGGIGLVEAAGRAYLRLDGKPVVFNQPDPRIPSGAVAGPRPLAESLREVLVQRLGGAVRQR